MIGHYEMSVDDYLAILRRRLWVFLVPLILGPVVGYTISRFLPERYTSQTLVMVEQQKVPEKFVMPVVNDVLNQRLASMQEQILSRSRLQPIIEKFNLFRGDAQPMEVLVARLRSTILVTPVKPIVRAPGDLPGFYISYTGSEPHTTQQVCSEITSMFMEENLKLREKAAQGTTDFLVKQLDDAKRKLDDQDRRLALFKQHYVGQLPDQEQANWNLLMSKTSALEATTQALNRTHQDKTYMESLLAQQIAAWEASKSGQNPLTMEQQLTQLENAMVALEARYTADHPDVIKARGDVTALKKRIAQARDSEKVAKQDDKSKSALTEPPQIQQIRGQIYQAEMSIKEKTRDQELLQRDLKVLQARVQLSPMVEQQYKELTRDYQTALGSYNDLLGKKTQSEIATDLERRQQGEQFRVIDEPNLPAKPSFPDPLLFSGGGLGGGLALGLGLIFLLETRDRSLRSEKDIAVLLELPTLALIPVVQGVPVRRRFQWFRRKREARTQESTA